MTDRSTSSFMSTSTPKITAKSTSRSNERCERKTLQTIQPSAESDKKFMDTGHPECGDSKQKKLVSNKNLSSSQTAQSIVLSIYHDPGTPADSYGVHCTRSVQTETSLLDSLLEERQLGRINDSTDSGHMSGYLDPQAYDLMVNESVPDQYWKVLAEERREALTSALAENKRLYDKIEVLEEENCRLSDLARKASELEAILKNVLSEEEGDDDNSDANESSHVEGVGVSSVVKKDSSSAYDNPDKKLQSTKDSY